RKWLPPAAPSRGVRRCPPPRSQLAPRVQDVAVHQPLAHDQVVLETSTGLEPHLAYLPALEGEPLGSVERDGGVVAGPDVKAHLQHPHLPAPGVRLAQQGPADTVPALAGRYG